MDNRPTTSSPKEPDGNWQQEHESPRRSQSKLRRVVSSRNLGQHIDSSESFPSEHESLFNGILASFESDRDNSRPPGPNNADTKACKSNALQRRASNASGSTVSHSGWLPRTLETIFERHSASTLHRSLTVSRVDFDGSSDVSNRSGASVPSRHCQNRAAGQKKYGHKIYSFDDLDIPNTRPNSFPTNHERRGGQRSSSSSSDSIFEFGYWLYTAASPVAPSEPLYPPPKRTPTPPGVPSFGSREAMRYSVSPESRNTSSSPQSNNSGWRCRVPQGACQNGDGDISGLMCCGIRLRRLLGLDPVNPPNPNALPQGAIARADDGTVVRGRWGARQSGHGVGAGPGARGLANHPFHRIDLPVARSGPAESPSWVTRSLRGLNLPGSSNDPQGSSHSEPHSSTHTSGDRPRNPPQPRRQYAVRSLIDAASPTVPVPAHIERRALKTPWPRVLPGDPPPQDGHNGVTIAPFRAVNDGPPSTPVQTSPAFTSPASFPNEWAYLGAREHFPHDTKPVGLWGWIWLDCLNACCGVNEDESLHELHPVPIRRRNDPAYGTIETGDGPGRRSTMSYPNSPGDGYGRSNSRPNNSRSTQRNSVGSSPWSPAWGWRPRCFGGDATVDD